jgi:hypothetical protein
MSELSGGCACGAIRYRCAAPPVFCLNCHCRDCQRESGSAFMPVMAVPKAAFEIERGAPIYFDLTADSGKTTPRSFRPRQDIFTASAQPWDFMNSELPKAIGLPRPPAD